MSDPSTSAPNLTLPFAADLKVALVHEWLVDYSGSERVVEQILQLVPHADLFAMVEALPEDLKQFIQHKPVRTSFIQHLPWGRRRYRQYLPLMPLAVEQFDLSQYDIVISSNHAVSKGVLTGPEQLHLSYVHSPMRYAWDLQHQYLRDSGLDRGWQGWLTKYLLHRVRLWDLRTANGVDAFVANSHFIARRIWKVYRRRARVIYPPVNLQSFPLNLQPRQDFYFTATRMVPYKRLDLIVEAFSATPHRRLVVAGAGPGLQRIRAIAGDNVEFIGYVDAATLRDYLQRARAFVFAAQEDFGIALVEAQACGTPVIAFGQGGAREIVQGLERDRPTGVFFDRQTIASLQSALQQFEQREPISPHDCHTNACRFSIERFRQDFGDFLETRWKKFQIERSRDH